MKRKGISGSITAEASLVLTLFILGYLCIISLIYAVRTESAVQFGINRAASEISRYCYAAERLSLDRYLKNAGMTVGEAIESIGDFSGLGNLSGSASDSSENGISQLADELSGGAYISGTAAEPIVRAVFTGCIGDSREETYKYFENLAGITPDDIDFHYSSLLRDGKTVEIVAVYKVRLRTFGLFGKKGISLTMKNTAAASAWVTGERSIDDSGEQSKWSLSSFERGKAWVSEIKSENSADAVKSGKGIDLCKQGKYSMINSVNIFAKTYSSCSRDGSSDPEDYTLRQEQFEQSLSGFALKLLECIESKGSSLQYENGIHVPDRRKNARAELIIVIPLEASESASLKNALENAAGNVSAEKGVEIRYEFREKAFCT